jgi:hypothetical protein
VDLITGGPGVTSAAIGHGRPARALSAAHATGILHRDVKPENVMVRPDGLVKVLDFGIAKVAAGSDAAAREIMVETRTGAVVGTAAYMSPEQARGLATDARTELWSLGCLLYEMLAGRCAFGRETVSDTIAAVLDREPDWKPVPVAVPPGVRRLLERCLEKEPSRRLDDAGVAARELEAGRVAAEAAVWDAPGRRRQRRLVLCGAAVLLMALRRLDEALSRGGCALGATGPDAARGAGRTLRAPAHPDREPGLRAAGGRDGLQRGTARTAVHA